MWPDFAAALARAGVAVQPFACAATVAEATHAGKELGAPMVARPLAPEAEYCAYLAEHTADVPLAFARAQAASPEKRVVLHRAAPGPLTLLCALRVRGGWEMFPAIDVEFLRRHARVPIAYTCPPEGGADLPAETLSAVFDVLAAQPSTLAGVVIEFTAGATVLFARSITTLDAPLAAVLHLAQAHGAGCVRFLHPKSGVVEGIAGAPAARRRKGVIAVDINLTRGDTIRHLTSIAARDAIGAVSSFGATPTEARNRAAAAEAQVRIRTRPVT